ncbi:ATP-dependent DNA helicase sgs1 [Fusarium falciforme]
MTRLMSSSKSRKPRLVSRSQQFLAPSSIAADRSARQDTPTQRANLGASRSDLGKTHAQGASPKKNPTLTPTPTQTRPLRARSPESGNLNADGVAYLDLTDHTVASSGSLSFGSDGKLWGKDCASRPKPAASSGKDRQSKGTSVEESSDSGDFPDIYQLLGTSPLLRALEVNLENVEEAADRAARKHTEPAMGANILFRPKFYLSARRTQMP